MQAGAVLSLPLFVGFNLLLASGTRSLFERLLARRRIREVVVLLTTMLWVAPRLLMSMGYEGNAPARWAGDADRGPAVDRGAHAAGQSIALRRYRSAAGSLPRAGSTLAVRAQSALRRNRGAGHA